MMRDLETLTGERYDAALELIRRHDSYLTLLSVGRLRRSDADTLRQVEQRYAHATRVLREATR